MSATKTNTFRQTEVKIAISVLFTATLIFLRVVYAGNLNYVFLLWNLFLAGIPLLCSRMLENKNAINYKAWFTIAAWLLFLPNAPYVITDFFHFRPRIGVPAWFDLLLLASASWNGLLLGLLSMMQVESFLRRFCHQAQVTCIIAVASLLCGYGVFIGRFLRFNSWDVISNPLDVLSTLSHHFTAPFDHTNTWGFTVLFSGMLFIIYHSLQSLRIQSR